MLKKLLLSSLTILSIILSHTGQIHSSSSAPASGNCPPCPSGSITGWVLLPTGPGGIPCSQTPTLQEPQPTEEQHHHHNKLGEKRSMHPAPTPEQEELIQKLKSVKGHIYLRANPNSSTPSQKEGTFGKVLDGKVYFMELGVPVYDPSVDPVKDIVKTSVREKIAQFNGAAKTQANQPTLKTALEAPSPKPTAIHPSPPKPEVKGGWIKNANGKWVRAPGFSTGTGGLSTTERPNLFTPDPRQEASRPHADQLLYGPNASQTGLTGKDAPRIDARATSQQD